MTEAHYQAASRVERTTENGVSSHVPQFMIEHGIMLITVAMLAAFCFKYRGPYQAH